MIAALVERILTSPPMPRLVRFDDLVWAVRVQHPDADVGEIDKAARPYERGAPGAYVYAIETDRQRVLPGVEER